MIENKRMEVGMMQKGLPVWEKLAKELIWEQIGALKGKTILDFGSGAGVTANRYAADNDVTAVEPSAEMLAERINTHDYRQLIGSTELLRELPDEAFDYIFCHNVLEYADDREEIVAQFYRLLKPGGRLSVVKHNRNGRVMQMVVLLNDFEEADALLDGRDSTAQRFGAIRYYQDGDIAAWCGGLRLKETFGLRTFWDLQQEQEIQKDEAWQEKMTAVERRVSQHPDFQRIAFFHHLIFEK